MQDKLKKLFDEIKVEDNLLEFFCDAKIDKVVIYDGNKLLDFIIDTKEVLPIDVYNNILYKLIAYFNTIDEIRLIIKPSNIDNSKIKDYYINVMKNVCLDRNKYNIFLDRDVSVSSDNVITIKSQTKPALDEGDRTG